MKLILNFGDKRYILTGNQMSEIAEILRDTEILEHKYMGGGQPYVDLIVPVTTATELKPTVMTNTDYEGLKLITKLHLEKSK